MTDQELQQLAKEIATENYKHFGDEKSIDLMAHEYEDVIKCILRTHCIVCREKVKDLCRLTIDNTMSVDYGLIDGLTDMVCDMFNEEYHKEIDNE